MSWLYVFFAKMEDRKVKQVYLGVGSRRRGKDRRIQRELQCTHRTTSREEFSGTCVYITHTIENCIV
jgi:hypothetical protein